MARPVILYPHMFNFHLTRHFLTTSSLVSLLFGGLVYQVDHLRSQAVHAIQIEESRELRELRSDLIQLVSEAAQRDLVTQQEQASIGMGRLLINGLWSGLFAVYLEQAQAVPFRTCGTPDPQADEEAQRKRQACQRVLGAQLARLPAFAMVDAAVRSALQDTPMYRLKVFDLQGITIYSTDHAQLGEDRSASPGWRTAREGSQASNLSRSSTLNPLHREPASRDFVNTYMPVYGGGGSTTPVAVMETYTDVRPFLDQLTSFTNELERKANAREERMVQRLDQERFLLDEQGLRSTLLLLALTLLVYLALLAIVHRAQRLIEQQAAQMQDARTHMMQTEKMAILGQMVAGVAHQLNTPLAYCRSNLHCFPEVFARMVEHVRAQREETEALAQAELGELPAGMLRDAIIDRDVADVRQMIDDIQTGIRMIEELVRQLRNFTRLDQGSADVIDLNVSIASAVYMARTLLSPKIRIDEHYGNLPRIMVRVSQINQAVLNLLMNAGQAITGAGCITVTTRLEDHFVVIDVSDDGGGITTEMQARVFDPFVTTKPDGTGLGLFLVRDIVQSHGGRVALRSAPGEGTSVMLYLPVDRGTAT